MGFITWIVVGLIAGWLAGQVMKGGGYGVIVDIILGILGGVLGGWLFGALGIWPGSGIVPMNHSNKDGTSSAEREEGRLRIKENAGPSHTCPTQSG